MSDNINYQIPLDRYDVNDRWAFITVPKMLTMRDAERICDLIQAVAFRDEE